jgi:photosystem II stability/assembly factor-like uncharacterized protein
VSAVTANIAYVATDSGIYKTVDGGTSWDYSTAASGGSGVDAVDADNVWAVSGQYFYRTTNGGTDWTQIDTGAGINFYGMCAVDANTAWAVGDGGAVYRVTSGGAVVQDKSDPLFTNRYYAVTAVSANTAWAVAGEGIVAKTTTGGGSWSYKTIGISLQCLEALNSSTVWAGGFCMYKTVNGGSSWSNQYEQMYRLDGIAVVDANTAWSVGCGSTILKTLDGGTAWFPQVPGVSCELRDIDAFDGSVAWAVGENGVVLHTTDGGGAKDAPHITSIAPSSGRVGSEVTINGTDFGLTRSSSYVSFGSTNATVYPSWSDTQVNVVVPDNVEGQVDIAVHTSGGNSNARTYTVITPTYYSYYFAEGCTRDGFDEWLCLQNPGSETLAVNATYMLFGGSPVERTYNVPATSRMSVNVNQEVGPGQDVSVRLIAEGEFYAERPMYFDYKMNQPGFNWTGGHCVTGAVSPGSDWYFAEGTTRSGFEEWICVLNPNDATVRVNVDYIMAGAYTIQKQYDVNANSRFTMFANGDVGPDQDVSVHVHCDQGVVVERPMYFNYHGKWDGGHIVMGTDCPKYQWYFAEGSTQPGFEEWLAVQNSNSQQASITVNFLKSDGTQQSENYTVGANSRWTLDVSSAVGIGVDSSIVITSGMPVVAERPIYFCYKEGDPAYNWTGGHDVVGSALAKTNWFFAEGCTYDWADEYVCVGNPGDETAHVVFKFMLEAGDPVEYAVDIEAHKRATIKVANVTGRGHDVSTKLQSDKPVVAERPMYFNYQGRWNGGHDVIGF